MLLRWFIVLLLFTLGWLSCSSNEQEDYQLLEGNFLDTVYQIRYLDTTDYQVEIDSLLKAIAAEISLTDSNSILQDFNKAILDFDLGISIADTSSNKYPKGRHFLNCFLASNRFFELSDGIFDPTSKPLSDYWSRRATIESTPITALDSLIVDSLMQYVGLPYIALEDNKLLKDQNGVQMDFEVLVKAYSADHIGKWLTRKGIDNFLITIGPFAHAKGRDSNGKFWKTNLKFPNENSPHEDVVATVQLPILSFAQATNSNVFEELDGKKYTYTISPITGFPTANSLIGVTVFYEDCLTAAALANTCMTMGYEQAVEFIAAIPGTEAHFVYGKENGKFGIKKTEGLRTLLELEAQ